jgi:hypothetical protein
MKQGNAAMKKSGTGVSVRTILESLAGASYMAAAIVLRPLFLPRLRRWGATAAELQRALPGDELVTQSRAGYTQAITIHAPVEAVWPWLAQIGQGRGGFYSYEVLENLVGCDIHSADRILPELQELKTGDGIRLHPNIPALPVAVLEPQRALLLYGSEPIGQQPDRAGPPEYFATTWLFYVEGLADGTTRLISRYRLGYTPRFGNDLAYRGFVEPISAVMQRKMLLGIKERAEAAGRV